MRTISVLQQTCISPNQLNLLFQSRTLWRDLATWLRAYIASKHGGLGDQEAIWEKLTQLLLRAATNFSLVFGEQYTEEFINLSSDFLNTLDNLFDAQISGNAEAEEEYIAQLYKVSDEIAQFLSRANPFWVESEWKNYLYQFNEKTIIESSTFLTQEYRRNIDIFDSILNLTSRIGDYYAQGILDYLTFYGR